MNRNLAELPNIDIWGDLCLQRPQKCTDGGFDPNIAASAPEGWACAMVQDD